LANEGRIVIDANFIMNGLTLAGILWIAATVSGLRDRVTKIEITLQLRKEKSSCNA
jgi:hypothetical protein